MSDSHIINIEDCASGIYTKVRKQLNKSLGGPEAWEYDKPMFTVECSSDDFDTLQSKLSSIEGIQFLADHKVVEVVTNSDDSDEEEEEVEEAPVVEAAKPVVHWDTYLKSKR